MVKIALIGFGDMGTKYALKILNNPSLGLELVCGTRIKPLYLDKIRGLIPSDFPFFQDDDELFAAFDRGEVSFDAVLVVTPHYAHEKAVKEAFKRNLHVLCDKPAGVYLRAGREMLEAKPQDRQYGFIFHQRRYGVNQKLKEIVDSKIYGNVKRVSFIVSDWYRTNAYFKSAPWRATYKTDGGGTLLNQCPHSVDFLFYLLGMPCSVYGSCKEGKYHDIEVEDEATAYLEWDNGVTGVFVASTGELPGVNRLEISFDRAVVTCSKNVIDITENVQPESYYRNQNVQYLVPPEPEYTHLEFDEKADEAYLEVLKGFVRAVESGDSSNLVADGSDSLMSLYFSNAVYLSSAKKMPVVFEPIGSENEKSFEKEFENWLESKKH